MNVIDKDHFKVFCSKLTIPSKEGGEDSEGKPTQLIPLKLLPTQLLMLDEICKGMEMGVREFVAEKCRQSLVTTFGMALDLYWCFLHDGLVLAFIGDSPDVVAYNRGLIQTFVRSLQRHPKWYYEITADNDRVMVFSNESRITWHVANKKVVGQLGQSVGLAAAHLTEVANWQDQEGVGSLRASFAKRNPIRLFLAESRPGAGGGGIFRKMCEEAERGVSKRFIFVPWWLHPWYDLNLDDELDSQKYHVYWKSKPVYTHDESIWIDGIAKRYKHQISTTQLAWWRHELEENQDGNQAYMYEQYPPLPDYGWKYGAHTWVSFECVQRRQTIIESNEKRPFRCYQVDWGDGYKFETCDLVEVKPESRYYDLITWEDPEPPKDGLRYVISCDPTHGADEKSTDACIGLWRAYADQLVQAAEFIANDMRAYQLAWIVLHLAGSYEGNPLFITELLGGGFELQNELRALENDQIAHYHPVLIKAFAGLEHYQWSRPDQTKPQTNTLHYKTTEESKSMMLEAFRGYFERNIIDVRSQVLLNQVKQVSWTNQGDLLIPRPNDALMSAALACMGYKQLLARDIGGMKQFYRAEFDHKKRLESGDMTQEEWLATHFLHNWRDRKILEYEKAKQDKIDEQDKIKDGYRRMI